jgi:hypothetical protein
VIWYGTLNASTNELMPHTTVPINVFINSNFTGNPLDNITAYINWNDSQNKFGLRNIVMVFNPAILSTTECPEDVTSIIFLN